jgi:hypothetical protein
MAPTPIYPNWFHERTLDVTANDALRKGLPTQSAEVKV